MNANFRMLGPWTDTTDPLTEKEKAEYVNTHFMIPIVKWSAMPFNARTRPAGTDPLGYHKQRHSRIPLKGTIHCGTRDKLRNLDIRGKKMEEIPVAGKRNIRTLNEAVEDHEARQRRKK